MRDSGVPPSKPPAPDPVESLLAEALLAPSPHAAIDAAAQRHPEHAGALRTAFEMLVRANLVAPRTASDGEIFGRFRLRELLGGGGMGLVHLAEEAPVGRLVALKRIRPELLHFGDARARFLREIAAIAALQHPGIVPIYSFGDHEGVPYYAMQHVVGRSLAAVLQDARPEVQADGTLLGQPGMRWLHACFAVAAQVAEALAHAHERGVLHRDIKPSNIMLAEDGRALLIDFGLARVEGDDGLTRSGVQPGSLAYMSPEQVRGQQVDARTDVWSLGATLQEMVTLVAPFAAATEEETRYRILSGTRALGDRPQRLPQDAAAVLATSLAPELDRRYHTMAAFAADLRSFVAHRPVAARQPSAWLRLRRYAQRRPALATALLLGLLLVVLLPTALYVQARAVQDVLRRDAETARAAVTFLEDLFAECEPSRARGNTVTARVILDRGVRRIREELRDQPAVQASLLEAMASAYLDLGLLLPAVPLLTQARELHDAGHGGGRNRVLELQARLAAARGDDADAERRWRERLATLPPMQGTRGVDAALTTLQLARSLWRQDRVDEAEDLLREAVGFLRRVAGEDPSHLARALLVQGTFLLEREDPLAAEPVLREAVQRLEQSLPDDHPDLLNARCELARDLRQIGNATEAGRLLAHAERTAVAVFDGKHPQLAMVREEMASLAIDSDRPADAIGPLTSAIANYREIYPVPSHVLARALTEQCRLQTALGDLRGAEAVAREALDHLERLYPEGHLDMAAALCSLSAVQTQAGNLAEAADLARRSLAMQERLRQRRTSVRALTAAHLGYALAFDGDFQSAEQLAKQAVEAVSRIRVEPATELRVRSYLVEILCLQRRGDDALAAIAPWRDRALAQGPTWQGWVLFLEGWAQELRRDFEAAERSLRRALAIRTELYGANHPLCGIVLGELGVVLANRGALEEAEQVLRSAVDIRRVHGGPHDVHLNLPLLNLGTVRMLRRDYDAARTDGEQVLANLDGIAGVGNPVGLGTVKLLLRLAPRIEDVAARRAALTRLRTFARTVLPPDDPLLAAIDKALESTGG